MTAGGFRGPRSVAFVCTVLLAVAVAGADFIDVGRTDRLDRAPYIKSYEKGKISGAVVALPVRLDPNSTGDIGSESRNQVLRALSDEMNRFLLSLDWVHYLDVALPAEGAPQLYVGSAQGEYAPPAAAMEMTENDDLAAMIIHVQKASAAWRKAFATTIEKDDAGPALVLTVGFSEYPKSRKGTFKKKVVLGTGHEVDIPFLSAELEPVHVLCVSGMLVDREGRILRAGAEGILSEDTPLWVQSFGVSKEIDTEAVHESLAQLRREDLPNRPLTWQVALQNLVAQLVGDQDRVID